MRFLRGWHVPAERGVRELNVRLPQDPDTAMASFVLVYRDCWPLLQRVSQLLAVDTNAPQPTPFLDD